MKRLLILALLAAMAVPLMAGRRGGYQFDATSTATVFTFDEAARHLEISTDADVTVRAWLTSETPSATFDGNEVLLPAGDRLFRRNGAGYQAITLQASGASATVSVTAFR